MKSSPNSSRFQLLICLRKQSAMDSDVDVDVEGFVVDEVSEDDVLMVDVEDDDGSDVSQDTVVDDVEFAARVDELRSPKHEADFVKVDYVKKQFIYFNKKIFNIPSPLISQLLFEEYRIIQIKRDSANLLDKLFSAISFNYCYLNSKSNFIGIIEMFKVEGKLYIFFPFIKTISNDLRRSLKTKQFYVYVQYYFFKRKFDIAFFAPGTKISKKYVVLPVPQYNRYLCGADPSQDTYKIKYEEYDFPHLFIAEEKCHFENFFITLPNFFSYRTLLMDDELFFRLKDSSFLRCTSTKIIKSLYHTFSSNFFSYPVDIKPWSTKPHFRDYDYYCCYDIETYVNNDGILEAYIIACVLYDKNFEIIDKQCFSKSFYNFVLNDDVCYQFYNYIVDMFCDPLDDHLGLYEVCLFGFNNCRFDDHIVLQQWFIKKNFNFQINKRGGLILMCELKNSKLRITVKDLAHWFPQQSLKSATGDFLSEELRKMDFNILKFNETLAQVKFVIDDLPGLDLDNIMDYFDLMTPYCDEAEELINKYEGKNLYDVCIDYCVQDVVSTFSLFHSLNVAYIKLLVNLKNKFTNFNFKLASSIFNYISPASFAGIISRCFLTLNGEQHIAFNNEEISKKIYNTYYGGRVCFGILGEYSSLTSLGYYDITSMYSLAMQANFPTITCENHNKECLCFVDKIKSGDQFDVEFFQKLIDENKGTIINDYIFFVMADAYLPDDLSQLISFGVLPERLTNGRINYPIKSFVNRFFNSVQLVTLRNFGYTIKLKSYIYNIAFYENKPIFDTLLKELVVFKSQAKQDENKSLAKLIKLIGSSIYGKYAQRPISKLSRVNNYSRYSQNTELEDYSNATHYISAIITSYANYILTTVFKELEKPYIERKLPLNLRKGALLYCDTDSIVFDTGITNFDPHYFPLDEELGSYEKENGIFKPTWKRKYPTAKTIIVLGKKSYFILNFNYQILNRALKGIHTAQMSRFTYEATTKVFEEFCTFKFKGLKRNRIQLVGFFGNKKDSPYMEIEETMIQKTLAMTLCRDLELKEYQTLEMELIDSSDCFQKVLLQTLELNLPFFEKKLKEHKIFKKTLFHFLNFIKYY